MVKLFCFLQLGREILSVAIRFLRAKTPEQRAAVDLDTHYSKVKDALNFGLRFAVDVDWAFDCCRKLLVETFGNSRICSDCGWYLQKFAC